jgi:hypothetical protein
MTALFALDWLPPLRLVLYYVALCTLCGGWLAVLVRRHVPSPLLVAPFFGMVSVALLALAFYVLLPVTLAAASMAALGLLAVLSVLFVLPLLDGAGLRAALGPMALLLVVLVIAVYLEAHAELVLGQPALLLLDGTDQAGYAEMADWFTSHLSPTFTFDTARGQVSLPRPWADPALPYESYPNFLVNYDPRPAIFIAFGQLALLAGRPASFVIDIGCAAILPMGILAVAGSLTRKRLGILALVALLGTSHWFEYSRSGFLGRMTALPGTILLLLLYARIAADIRRLVATELLALMVLTIGVALMLNGVATAHILGAGGLIFALAAWWFERPALIPAQARERLVERLALLFAAIIVAIIASSYLSRPLRGTNIYPIDVPWDYVFARLTEMASDGIATPARPEMLRLGLIWLHLPLALAIAAIAWARRDGLAAALALAPLLTLLILFATDNRAMAVQQVGVAFPLLACAAVKLATETTGPRPLLAALVTAALVLALHLPRFAGAVERYAGAETPPDARYTLVDFDRLAAAIGPNAVYVDTGLSFAGIEALTELGRRGVNLRLSPDAWLRSVGYRRWLPQPWAVPEPDTESPFILSLRDPAHAPNPDDLVIETQQFQLMRRHE